MKPKISANDDGTTSIEWRTQTRVLLIGVDGENVEVYYSDGADEWEADLKAIDADGLADALRSLSR